MITIYAVYDRCVQDTPQSVHQTRESAEAAATDRDIILEENFAGTFEDYCNVCFEGYEPIRCVATVEKWDGFGACGEPAAAPLSVEQDGYPGVCHQVDFCEYHQQEYLNNLGGRYLYQPDKENDNGISK